MAKTKVSVCIVTYNSADQIEETVQSLYDHTKGVSFQLYISDNKSTDNTIHLIQQKFPQAIVLENGCNKGFGYGHNAAIRRINSEYHLILNPDILLHDDVISRLAAYLDTHPDVAMVTPKVLNTDGTEQHLPKRDPTFRYVFLSKIGRFSHLRDEYTMADCNVTDVTDVEFCTGCFMFVRTAVLKQLGGFDDRYFMYCEDADLSREVRKIGRVVFYPFVSVCHKWERASSRKLKFVLIHLKSMAKYFWKWK